MLYSKLVLYKRQMLLASPELFLIMCLFFHLQDVLRRLLAFCNDSLRGAEASSDSQSEVLAILSKLMLYKRPERRDGVYTSLQQYPLKTDRLVL